jgi:hypothetical protein
VSLDSAIARLRELNGSVPKPLRLPTETEVAEAETKLGVKFPPDYREYLLQASDVVFGVLEPAVVIPDYGYLDLVHMAKNAWAKLKLPRTFLPFCEDNGDYYCFTSSGEVVFWSHNGWDGRKWPNLAAWIDEVWIKEFLGMHG